MKPLVAIPSLDGVGRCGIARATGKVGSRKKLIHNCRAERACALRYEVRGSGMESKGAKGTKWPPSYLGSRVECSN